MDVIFKSQIPIEKNSTLVFTLPTYSQGSHPFVEHRATSPEGADRKTYDVDCSAKAPLVALIACEYNTGTGKLIIKNAFSEEIAAETELRVHIERFKLRETPGFYNMAFQIINADSSASVVLPRYPMRIHPLKLNWIQISVFNQTHGGELVGHGLRFIYPQSYPDYKEGEICGFFITAVSSTINFTNAVGSDLNGIVRPDDFEDDAVRTINKGKNWIQLVGLCDLLKQVNYLLLKNLSIL